MNRKMVKYTSFIFDISAWTWTQSGSFWNIWRTSCKIHYTTSSWIRTSSSAIKFEWHYKSHRNKSYCAINIITDSFTKCWIVLKEIWNYNQIFFKPKTSTYTCITEQWVCFKMKCDYLHLEICALCTACVIYVSIHKS